MGEDLSFLRTVKQRVEWIYNQSQDAVDNNDVLASKYEEYFGSISESVYRAGRFLRSDRVGDKRFVRTPEKIEMDNVLFDLVKNFYGKGCV